MPYRFQYPSETGPISPLPALVPKLAWLPHYPDMIARRELPVACVAASGQSGNPEFRQVFIPNSGGGVPVTTRLRLQYQSETGPLFVSGKSPKRGWAPDFPDIVPWSATLPVACIASSGELGHPEFTPVKPLPAPRVWAPDYPDFARGPAPLPIHPSFVLGFPPTQLPLNPAFMGWKPEYPDFAKGKDPLIIIDWSEGASFFDDVRPPANPYGVAVYVNGIDRYPFIFIDSLEIDDILNEQPNVCRFRFDALQTGLVINGGEEIIIEIGTNLRVGTPTRIFGGTVTDSEQIVLGDNARNISYNVTCQDYTYLLNRRKPLKRYVNVAADLIVADLVNSFSSSFTTAGVQAGLPVVSIDFDGSQDFSACLTDLANLVGAYWFPNYFKDIKFFVTWSGTAPDVINDANALTETGAHHLKFQKSLTQVRNRVIVVGATASVDIGTTSAAVAYQLPAGSITVPISTQVAFSVTGGVARLNAQDISYTGISSCAAKATLSDGILQTPGIIAGATVVTSPSVGPSGNLIGPSGNLSAGLYQYKVTFVNDKNEESEGSGTSRTVTLQVVSGPGTASLTQASGLAGNLSAAFYGYKISFKTSNGETLPGPANFITTTGVSAPVNSATANWNGQPGNLGVGTWQYKVTFKTSNGETEASGAISGSINRVSDFSATCGFSLSVSGGGAGNTGVNGLGFYNYLVTCVDSQGETVGNSISLNNFGFDTATVNISGSGDARVRSINLYRQISFGGYPGNFGFVGAVGPTGGTIVDKFPASSLTTQPFTVNTTGSGQLQLTNVPISSDPRVQKRGLYRLTTTAFGPQYLHIADIGDNVTTSYLDNVAAPDGTVAPTANSANNCQVQLTNLPTSSDPRVVARVVYRTVAGGGGSYAHVTTVSDNVTTAFLDNVADANLGSSSNPPLSVSTADNGVVSLTGIPLGSGLAKLRRVYRTLPGGSDFKFAFSIGDNVTTAILDNTADSSLGVSMPTQSSWRTRAGATVLPLEDVTQISESIGWVKVGSQVVYYTGRSATGLTGIPATGLGSLANDVTFETQVVGMPFLKGVTGLIYDLNQGDSIAIKVVRNDLAAQAALSALEGGDGIHEETVRDTTLANDAQCNVRGDAELILFALQIKGVTYDTRDIKTKSGTSTVVAITNRNISVTLQIQEVRITRITADQQMQPLFSVTAAPTKYTLQDLIRQLSIGQ